MLLPLLPPGRTVAVPGRGELFVRTFGDPGRTPPVLLLHGWQATADLNFFPLFGPLAAEGLTGLAPDLRGHGRSVLPEAPFTLEDAADDVAALLREVGTATPVLVLGYSIGSAVAQVLARRHPELVAGLVLMAAEPGGAGRPHEKAYNRIGGWQGTLQRLSSGRWGAHRLVSKAARENRGAEALRPWLTAEMERGHPGSLRAAGRALGRFSAADVARPEVPTTVVVTRRDRLVRPVRQERLAALWDAEVIDLDADHDAPVAQPEAFVAAALEAVRRTAIELEAVAG
jgi:3-oxoadipate enol-lactonase